MKRYVVEYTYENCPVRSGLMCDAHSEDPELRCHMDPERKCSFVRVEIEKKEEK